VDRLIKEIITRMDFVSETIPDYPETMERKI